MNWKLALKKTEIRPFNPGTASQKKVERKKAIRNKLKKKIGKKKLQKLKMETYNHPLFVDVCFYLLESEKLGRSKKDLDNLLKILFDAMSDNMVNGQKPIKGLGLMKDDSSIYKINCEKKPVSPKEPEGFDLIIKKDPRTLDEFQ